MKRLFITYPQIKGATPILGWVHSSGMRIDLKVGEAIKVTQDVAIDLKATFPFLEISEASEGVVVEMPKIKPIAKTKKVIKESAKPEEKSLKKRAVELGVFRVGMNGGQMRKAIKDAEN